MTQPILEICELKKYYYVKNSGQKEKQVVKAVDDVSFSLKKGSTLAIVGESGSGKTTIAKLIMKFEELTAGMIKFNGQDIQTFASKKAAKGYCQKVQMVHQDPTSSLNPSKTIAQIIEEPLIVHQFGTKEERYKKVEELIQIVELPIEFLSRYPHTLSGGQKQRVGIARAIALDSELIILDEPTSALDVSVQEKIIFLLEKLQRELNLSYLFITHDLALVRNFSKEVVVMQLGNLVEAGQVKTIFDEPQEPYTKKLIKSIPVVSQAEQTYLDQISL